MTHFICKEEKCVSISDRPGVCMSPYCSNRYKLLDECTCPHRSRHLVQISMPDTKQSRGHSIDIVNFGLALGMSIGSWALILGVLSIFGIGVGVVESLSTFYIGYDSTLVGSVAGSLWGLVYGFLGGVLVAWLYNQLSRAR